MPLKQSEAIVLRTYPLREADLLVTLFTRAEGKVKGVARSAKKSKRRFGGALEPLTWVRAYYDDREGQELARLDSCDILESPLSATVDYPRVVALEHVAETLDELLPDREANDAIFRLAVSVLHQLRSGSIWMPLTYFQLWLVRLVGFLPELGECTGVRTGAERQPGVLSCAGRWPDVRAAQAAGVVGAVGGIASLGGADVPLAGGKLRRRAVDGGAVMRTCEVPGADHGAPHREEAGDGRACWRSCESGRAGL